jgi:hypothetical protein
MSLPILTSDEDVQKVIDYFKTKATGNTISEAKPILGKFLDARKINGYLIWGFLKKEGDKLSLTERGRRLSKSTEKSKIYKEVIKLIRPYNSCIEWAYYKKFESISNIEVGSYWHEHLSSEVGTANETTLKDMAVCFFYVCQAADLGKMIIGRKGQPTRLELNVDNLKSFIEDTIPNGLIEDENDFVTDEEHTDSYEEIIEKEPEKENKYRVFISHGKNMEIVDQIKTMLDLAELEYEIAVEKESVAIPVPEKVLTAMRKCTAAIICVTADAKEEEAEEGDLQINQNVLIEIGAAFVLYDKRVILVWDKRLKVPSNLQGLYRSEIQGGELSWKDGMKLMKTLNEFKK